MLESGGQLVCSTKVLYSDLPSLFCFAIIYVQAKLIRMVLRDCGQFCALVESQIRFAFHVASDVEHPQIIISKSLAYIFPETPGGAIHLQC